LGGDLAVFVVDHPHRAGLAASGAGTISTRLPAPNNISARAGYIQWIATDADARRRGCARLVMDALLAWYDEQRVPLLELHATDDGEPLYRLLGFDRGPHPALRRRAP
jgi:GNAT superfamily N-acetyltransferase